MKEIKLNLSERSYSIVIGRNLLASLGRLLKPLGLGSKVLIVSNRCVAGLFLKTVQKSLKQAGFNEETPFLLPHGDERDKSKEVLFKLWEHLAHSGFERTSTLVALGGGVVGDLAGFAASTFMRGIRLIQVPTTLLAQVDSAIGGKTAIDLPSAKNIIGTFYEPRLVVCDVQVLERMGLSKEGMRGLRNSLAEVIKYGVIQDKELFKLLEEKIAWFLSCARKKILGPPELSFLETVVARSARVKAGVVEEDEHETKGRRLILNYGHTFAHAFEAASNYRIQHGEAVALGMVCAARLAWLLGIFSKEEELRQRRLIWEAGLPVHLGPYRLRPEKILDSIQLDKKKKEGRLRFVLPVRMGKVQVFSEVSASEINRVLSDMKGG